MKHGSLFSGIGGFDLAAEWMGWENVFHCEWNPFGQKVLKHYWPNAKSYHDITKTDFTIHRGSIDILTGGFPCQPYSLAGKRLGKEDERHLWPQMCRAIREIQPRWVVGENVFGLVNWNGGMVFNEVQADLEAEGYEVQPYVLPAAAVNAPHRRDRVWFVAYSDKCSKRSPGKSTSIKRNRSNINDESSQWRESTQFNTGCNEFLRNAANTNGNGFNQCNGNDEKQPSERGFNAFSDIDTGNEYGLTADTGCTRWEKHDFAGESDKPRYNSRVYFAQRGNWQNFPTVSPICSRNDGLSNRLDNITFSKWRNESIKAAGNAITPQVVYPIFKAIQQYDISIIKQSKPG